jgi:RNA polymerase sigma-70 factor (ECF subfamily)
MWGLALRLLGSRGEAEDAVQEAWLRAVRDLERFEGRSRFETWVTGILVHCCREQRRRVASARRRLPAAEDETEEAAAPISGAAAAAPARLDVEAVLRDLPDGYREVLVLHDLFGYTHAEIARMLEIEEGTSKSQLARARRAARSALDGRPPLPPTRYREIPT